MQQFKREGKQLPPDAAVDENGQPTTDPDKAKALIPFGKHKGYGLALYNEVIGALIGGSLPTLRGPNLADGEKHSCTFYFQVIHPDAISSGLFAKGRTQKENLKAVLDDVFAHGNETATLPGQIEAQAAAVSEKANGLLFTTAEIDALNEIARECGQPALDAASLPTAEA